MLIQVFARTFVFLFRSGQNFTLHTESRTVRVASRDARGMQVLAHPQSARDGGEAAMDALAFWKRWGP